MRTERLSRKESNIVAMAICSCGSDFYVRLATCFNSEFSGRCGPCNWSGRKTRLTHGYSGSKMHRIWKNMRARVKTPAKPYLRRGIKVCERWNDFLNFLADVGEKPSPLHTLERIDNDGDYEPGNVKWATMREQSRNRTTTVLIEAFGENKTIGEWAEDVRCVVKRASLKTRIISGWKPETAITTATNALYHKCH